MDNKMKIAIVIIVIAVLAIPLAGKLVQQSSGGGASSSDTKAEDAPVELKPPLLNAGNLPNTKWNVTIEKIPVTVTFLDGGKLRGESPIVKQFTGKDYIEGTWEVNGADLTITASALGQTKTVTLKISGDQIVVKGKPVSRVQ